MMAPPGYPKIVSTPSAINASSTACDPDISIGCSGVAKDGFVNSACIILVFKVHLLHNPRKRLLHTAHI